VSLLRGRYRAWAGRILLVLGGLTIGFLAAEMLVRLIMPQHATPAFVFDSADTIHQLDPTFGFVNRSNIAVPFIFGTQVRTNSLGLRDQEFGPKREGNFRILSLGDSYAFGFGVNIEQSYGKVLERELSQAFPAVNFSVIDAGVEGYGTRQMLLSFERLQPRLQPDFVLATFVAGNDVYDNAMFEDRLRTHLNTPLGPLGRHSQAVQLFLRVTFPLWFTLANRDSGNIDHTVALLRELESSFRRAHVPYLMVVIPARHQIRPAVEPGARLLMDLGFRDYVFRQNRMVMEHFQRDGVPYVDTWPALVAQDSSTRVSFTSDSHLNASGHETVARAILPKVRAAVHDLLERSAVRGRHSRREVPAGGAPLG
jgi:lysophospholipase L1-like esterase